ncbi:hypothetical protein [Clostridium estertheticum]|uniref:hypothetical protein n=1 Tax=Clostridium estertheticum TaxID=238834 RepID=UPI001C0B3CD2|nr:hypothetical protein [Clostridium estertheticum]MBU3186508.1 hypothetical protein [Clostridium estertheticum]
MVVGNQIFIRVKGEEGNYYDKDIQESSPDERIEWYNTLSKGQVVSVLEQIGGFKLCK